MILLLINLIINGQYMGELETYEYNYVNSQIIIEVIPDLIYMDGFENDL